MGRRGPGGHGGELRHIRVGNLRIESIASATARDWSSGTRYAEGAPETARVTSVAMSA
ncbi:hypothetical protein ACFQ51_54380 [Streptomyces kaempferi]